MTSMGERPKEERERLELNQTQMGAVGGVKKLAQIDYEKGLRFPSADYLVALVGAGVDVMYVLTGERLANLALSADEQQLLAMYEAAPLQKKMKAVLLLSEEIEDISVAILSGGHLDP